MKKKVNEVTLTVDDLKVLEQYLIDECKLDTLDIMELIFKIEELKKISLNI